jgi:hypothetical protein
MPSYFVVQPNGLLALFSTVVDDFTALDMTEQAAVQMIVDEYAERAKHEAERGIERAKQPDRENRWKECLHTIAQIHGDETAAERSRELCQHDRLNKDGICRQCGADRSGI